MKTKNFRNMEAYKKWLAFGHLHGYFKKTKGYQRILIKGKPHKVKHE